MEISENIVQLMRNKYLEGAKVPELVQIITDNKVLNKDERHNKTVISLYFESAFKLALIDVILIGEWKFFKNGRFNDNEINAEILPLIEKNKEKWLKEIL